MDVGCGGGFNSNFMASLGHQVVGVDLSAESLEVAKRHDVTGAVEYRLADAAKLPFGDGAFDAVMAMDFLEHVDDVQEVIAEIGRVLKPGGLFFFHTFNRNLLAWFVNIKLVEWIIPNTPPEMHLLRMFIKPTELTLACMQAGLSDTVFIGTKPLLGRLRYWQSILFKREVPDDFSFEFTKSVRLAYCGMASKK